MPDETKVTAATKRSDVNGNRVFRVSQITVADGKTLVLGPDDQVFHVGTRSDNQWPSLHTFVVLERVDPDA